MLKPGERCDCKVIHEDVVEAVFKAMPKEVLLSDLSDLFKVLSDLTRIKILWALSEAELCVCDIAYLLNISQSAMSHQLRILKQARLVRSRKEGKSAFYSLDDHHVASLFKEGLAHIKEAGRYR